ncbi:MAG: trypsin-like peptidase domain-containing protein [Bifidobacteriaceae bacterium]|jgi:putative serine protease PepD|nr:trypsin-like peptidase domain-containing protein [Bifidobacteriaceae bacterium]
MSEFESTPGFPAPKPTGEAEAAPAATPAGSSLPVPPAAPLTGQERILGDPKPPAVPPSFVPAEYVSRVAPPASLPAAPTTPGGPAIQPIGPRPTYPSLGETPATAAQAQSAAPVPPAAPQGYQPSPFAPRSGATQASSLTAGPATAAQSLPPTGLPAVGALPAVPVGPQSPAGSQAAQLPKAPPAPQPIPAAAYYGGQPPATQPPVATAGQQPPAAKPAKGVTRAGAWGIAVIAAVLAACLAGGGVWLVMDKTGDSKGTISGSAGQQGSSQTQTDVSSGQNTASLPAAPDAGEAVDWSVVAAAVAPTVVAIQVDMDSWGYGAQGSGVIVNAEKGYVVTNNHVVADGRSIAVVLADGRIFDASIVGTDASTDLAVLELKNPPSDLKEAVLGDSNNLVVGEPVMAVGNPLGYDNTVTTGIVSALNRPVSTEASGQDASGVQVVTNAVQVDAAINPGNSGGPLFNAAGEVVGINSSIATLSSYSDTSGSIGLAFAIPVNLVANVSSQLIENGTAEHPYLGVTAQDSRITVDGVTRSGAELMQVQNGTPAADAGLKNGDVILSVDGNNITGSTSLTAWIRSYLPGDTVTLSIYRNGDVEEVTATLTVRED